MTPDAPLVDIKDVEAFRRDLEVCIEAWTHQPEVVVSGLASKILDMFVRELEAGNRPAANEMRRFAQRLLDIADAPPDRAREYADALADGQTKM